MSAPTVRDVHIDVALTNVSVKYKNAKFIGERLFTVLPVRKDSDVYFIYGKQDFRIQDDTRAPGGRGKKVEWTISKSDAYRVKEHSNEMQLIDEIRDNADDPIRYDADSTEYITNIGLLNLEYTLSAIAQDVTNYGASNQKALTGTDKWSDNSSDPLGQVQDAIKQIENSIFLSPNIMIISNDVFKKIKNHPQIREQIKYTHLGVTTPQLLAQFFEVDEVVIGLSGYVSDKEGQSTETLTQLWSNCVILAYVNPRATVKTISYAFLFRKEGYRNVEKWREPETRSDWIRVNDKYDKAIVANTAGYIFTTVV